MSLYFLNNINLKLKKSVITTDELNLSNNLNSFIPKKHIRNEIKNRKILFLNDFFIFFFKKLIYNFLFNFSNFFFDKKNKKKIFLSFLLFYKYFNFFFDKKKKIISKKYFSKKGLLFYLKPRKRFPLFKSLVRFNNSIDSLKKKKIDFFKKYVWKSKKWFKLKNLLIFNKKFIKAFSRERTNIFLFYSWMDFLNLKLLFKSTSERTTSTFFYNIYAKGKFSKFFYKNYHYRFHFRRFKLSKSKKKKFGYNKKKIFLFLPFRRRRRFRRYINKKLHFLRYYVLLRKRYARWRGGRRRKRYLKRKRWNWKTYYPLLKTIAPTRLFFYAASLKLCDAASLIKNLKKKKIILKKKRKKKVIIPVLKLKKKDKNKKNKKTKKVIKIKRRSYLPKKTNFQSKVMLKYLLDYREKLVKKHYRIKNFREKFGTNIYHLFNNVSFFLRLKKKKIFIQTLNIFKNVNNLRNFSFALFCYKFLFRKIKWRRRRYSKKFLLFFLNKFLFKKFPFFFKNKNITFKGKKFYFFKLKKKWVKKKWRIFYWHKKRRRKRFKKWFMKRILRIFIILLLLRFLKKTVNLRKLLLIRNANIMKNLKTLNLRFVSYSFSNFLPFYFKTKKNLLVENFLLHRRNNGFFFLLKKK